jgi:hypothetical protein
MAKTDSRPWSFFTAPANTPGVLAPAAIDRLVWLFTALGVTLRAVRYLLAFPLWCDEYQLAANFLDAGFADLLHPLHHNQVAPIGFLWIELAAIRLFGFSELSLRLFPALCGIGSVFLFRYAAMRVLRGVPLLLAVATFAVAYYPIRHGAEVKPYSSDLFLSLLLFCVAIAWWRPGSANGPEAGAEAGSEARSARPLWLLAVLGPLALSISFTAAFVAGGLSLGIGWTLWRSRGGILPVRPRSATLAWVVFNLAVAVSFLGLMQLNISAQYNATRNEMTACWADGFPPWRNPLHLIGWLADVHTGAMFAYPVGAEHGGSVVTFVCFALGLYAMFRRGPREIAITVVGWFALSLVAAALHRYPYGSHARLSQYLAPGICLLAGSGGALLITRLRRRDWRTLAVRACVAGGILMAVGTLIRDVVHPYKSGLDRQHRDFARRFWNECPDELTVCLQTDLGLRLYEGNFETAYLCNQRIYSPARSDDSGPIEERIDSASGPLRCVVFHSVSARRDEERFSKWMRETLARYDLIGTETHRWPLSNNHDNLFDFYTQSYDVYHFAPKRPAESDATTERIVHAGDKGPDRR